MSEKIIKDLESLVAEIRCDGIETNEDTCDIIEDICFYLENGDELFDEVDRYEDKEDFLDTVKNLINEVRIDGDREMVKMLYMAFETIEEM